MIEDPREEQRYTDAEDYRLECLEQQASDLFESYESIVKAKDIISKQIEKYDEYIDEILNEFPQHIIDKFKFKIGE